jgi:hypothetical protein
MRASSVVMAGPLTTGSAQMRSIQRDKIIQTFATDRSNQAFSVSVGGRHANGRFEHVDALTFDFFIQAGRESLVSIVQEKLVILIAGKRFPQLLQRPVRGGVFGHVEVNETSGSDLDRNKYIKDTEACRDDTKNRKLRCRARDSGGRLTSAGL